MNDCASQNTLRDEDGPDAKAHFEAKLNKEGHLKRGSDGR